MNCPFCKKHLNPNKGWASQFYIGYCNHCDMPIDHCDMPIEAQARIRGPTRLHTARDGPLKHPAGSVPKKETVKRISRYQEETSTGVHHGKASV